jgi:P-type Ca2+ transporter type 2C
MNLMVISVTLLIVIIPEGLPIAVSIASSFSTTHLMEDNILIKKL